MYGSQGSVDLDELQGKTTTPEEEMKEQETLEDSPEGTPGETSHKAEGEEAEEEAGVVAPEESAPSAAEERGEEEAEPEGGAKVISFQLPVEWSTLGGIREAPGVRKRNEVALQEKPAGPKAKAPAKKDAPRRPKKINVRTIRRMKERGEKITMLTAYDATFARILDQAGVEMLLVGDSLSMVIQGQENTLPVSLDEMIYHTRCVARVTQRALVVGDLPFMSYQRSAEQALESAGRMMKESGAQAIKLEGDIEVADSVRRICRAGIPVVAHIGLTPQSLHAFGGYVIQGREEQRARQLLEGALALEEAGAFCLVLEGIPAPLAQQITSQLSIPTIGIGAGKECDGQVLVIYDMLGMDPDFQPRFVKRFVNLHDLIQRAVGDYLREVKAVEFPGDDHSFY